MHHSALSAAFAPSIFYFTNISLNIFAAFLFSIPADGQLVDVQEIRADRFWSIDRYSYFLLSSHLLFTSILCWSKLRMLSSHPDPVTLTFTVPDHDTDSSPRPLGDVKTLVSAVLSRSPHTISEMRAIAAEEGMATCSSQEFEDN